MLLLPWPGFPSSTVIAPTGMRSRHNQSVAVVLISEAFLNLGFASRPSWPTWPTRSTRPTWAGGRSPCRKGTCRWVATDVLRTLFIGQSEGWADAVYSVGTISWLGGQCLERGSHPIAEDVNLKGVPTFHPTPTRRGRG